MDKKKNLISDVTFETVTGKIAYNLTNDYMFKATLQECKEAQIGLISALLMVDPDSLEVEVTNPILLGKSLASKDFYLDVRVIINKEKCMNLEMQVNNEGNWVERSLSYTSRLFDNLEKGEDYRNVNYIHHVGFVDFDVLDNENGFYDTFMLANTANSKIYTDRFKVSVVNLKRIDEATSTDKSYKLDKWARLIKATTWEELREISKEDPLMEATARTLYSLIEDFDNREEARRREEYYARVKRLEDTIAEKDAIIAELKTQLEALKK